MLVTATEAKAAVSQLASTSDTEVDRLVSIATKEIEGYLQRPLEEQTVTFTLVSGDGSEWLTLKHYPITAVASVTINDEVQTVDTVTSSTPLPLESQTVWRTPDSDLAGQLYRAAGWPGYDFKIAYTGGYTSSTVPADLREAIYKVLRTMLASDQMDTVATGKGALKREATVAGWDREWYPTGTSRDQRKDTYGLLTKEVRQMIRRYSWKGLLR